MGRDGKMAKCGKMGVLVRKEFLWLLGGGGGWLKSPARGEGKLGMGLLLCLADA